jgi:SAM-dependent methyltransferase
MFLTATAVRNFLPAPAAAHAPPCEWARYVVDDYAFASFPPGARVLDVGFGNGRKMRTLTRAGAVSFGIETDSALAHQAVAAGLRVCQAEAEQLPFGAAAFDGVICKVVIPYTDEARVLAEIARVLRPGAIARVSYHGLGYSLRYLLFDRDWKRRVYAARTIVNTLVYRLIRRRLPGALGDTLYQSPSRLRAYYRRTGLELDEEHRSPRFAGAPVFIYHTLRRAAR